MIYVSLTNDDLKAYPGKSPLDEVLDSESTVLALELLKSLPTAERDALAARFGFDQAPLVSGLAREWGCKRQYVYQLAERGLARLRKRALSKGLN